MPFARSVNASNASPLAATVIASPSANAGYASDTPPDG